MAVCLKVYRYTVMFSVKFYKGKRPTLRRLVTRKCVCKTLCPNHMPDPKGEWSLKENNSELHYGICSKVYQFIYTLVFNYMPIIRILAKGVLHISCSKGCSYTKCLCPKKRRVTQPEIYGICSKVNQFIYTLVWNYMPNIRILAKAVLKIFCSQGCSYTKCLCPKKGNNSTENLWNRFKS